MSDQYDAIAALYHQSIKELPFREHAETERGLAPYGRESWQPYLDRPHALCLEATRP